jgi:hypothetical protein
MEKYLTKLLENFRKVCISRKVADSRSDDVNALFSIYLILLVAQFPWVNSASNRNEYQKQKKVSGE